MPRTIVNESLADAVDRLLDCIYDDFDLAGNQQSAAFLEAIELTRLAYIRERKARDEFHTDFPQVWECSDAR